MASLPQSDTKHEHCVCTVEASPAEVDAGADLTLQVRVECPRKDELRGSRVSIRNHEGAELACAGLQAADGEAYESDDIVLAAPRALGEYVYRAVILADKDGTLHERASAKVGFVVKPHGAQLNVWDVPTAIVAGERFTFTVGIRCSAGCNLAGEDVHIVERDGPRIGSASLGRDVWPGTDAVYFAEVEAVAPQAPGNHRWAVETAAWSAELPHAAGALEMTLKVVSPPDCEVAVEVMDREKQTPIKDASVVMHPYRTATDETGMAKVRVTKGQYDILVSAPRYVPASIAADVKADMTTRAELDQEGPWDPADDV